MDFMIQEYRQATDRRANLRHPAQIEIQWEGAAGKQPGTISDLGRGGCFVLCSGAVENGEKVKLYFSVESNKNNLLKGEGVDHFNEIGFAVRFVELSETDELFLNHLLYHLTQVNRSLKKGR